MSNNSTTNRSICISVILFFVFFVLKLTNIIDWSWLWVTSPLWAIPMLIFIIAVIMAFFLLIISIFLLIKIFIKKI